MKARKTKKELLGEIKVLEIRLQEAEALIRTIRKGEVDGLMATTPEGDRVFTLEETDLLYPMFVEAMNQGAAIISRKGNILYANPALAQMLRLAQEKLINKSLRRFIHPADRDIFATIFAKGTQDISEGEVLLIHNTPAQISLQPLLLSGAQPVLCAVITDLTRQKKLKATINALNRSRAVFNQATDAIVICDEQGIITQASRATQHYGGSILLGRSFNEVIAISFASETPRRDEPFTINQVLQGTIVRKREATVSADNKTFYVLLSAQPLRGKNREIVGCVVTLTDITVRKNKEDEVRRSRKTFSELIERAPFGIYVVDSQLRIIHMNTSSQQGPFRKARPVIGRAFTEVIHVLWPDMVAAEIVGRFRHTLETGEPYISSRFIRPRRDSDIMESYEWELHRMVLPDGQNGVICYYYDSTRLREAESAVKLERDRLSSLIASMQDEVWFADNQQRFTLANPAAKKTFELSKDEAIEIAKLAERLNVLRADGSPRPVEDSPPLRALRGEIVTNEEEIIFVPAEKKLRHRQVSATPVRGSGGQIIGSVSVVRDITEFKKIENALRQRTHDLEMLGQTLEQRVQERTEELRIVNQALQESETRLKQLSRDLLDAQEKERKKIAWELHDSIGSSLMAIKFRIESVLRESASNGPQAMVTLKQVIPLLQTTVLEVKKIQMNLRPSILDDIGLVATTQWLCNQFKETYPEILLERHVNIEESDVPEHLKTVIFRIIQEGLNNVARHSESPVASFYLRKSNQILKLLIRDRGTGFDLSEVQSRSGYAKGVGLESMRERTELSGGLFSIATKQGKGTIVRASWPINTHS